MAIVKQKIVPHLWFDKEAKEAAEFYCSVFPDSGITNVSVLRDTPSGDCDVVSFKLSGQPFMVISAGPLSVCGLNMKSGAEPFAVGDGNDHYEVSK